ncbi:Outer envelope pore protein 16-4, chloroplastic-like protein [Drosera capensis]
MEGDLESDVPCASIAVDSLIRFATDRVIWGLCSGSHDATKQGLTGRHHASFVVKSMGKYGVQCGLLGGVFSFTCCGGQRLRGKSDWVNGCIAGAIAGAAVCYGWANCLKTGLGPSS